MNETITLILNSIRMVWRFRWVALLCALLTALVGWFFVLLLPDQYMVSTRVFLDTRSVLRPVLQGLAVDTNMRAEETALLMKRTLLSRPNLEKVVRETDLSLRAKSPEQLEALIENLGTRIGLVGTTRDNIYQIAFTDSDPKIANRVVNSFLNIFVERSLGEDKEDADSTRAFVERQVAEYERRLTEAEDRLKAFKQKNVGVMPEDGANYYGRLTEVRAQLATAQLEFSEARRRRDALRSQIEGIGSLFEMTVEPSREDAPHPLNARIKELESQLDQHLLRFTDSHPDVRATRSIIEQLRERRDADLDARAELGGGDLQPENKVLQDLRVATFQADAEAAALETRVGEFRRRVEELEKLVDTVPAVEAELSRLNRDYNVTRENYEALLKRKEALSLSQEAGETTEDYKFRIIDPPKEPLNPEGPNRMLMGSGVFVVSLGAGVAIAWLIAFLVPGVYTQDDFEDVTKLPVLGVVTRVWSTAEIAARRFSLMAFFGACGLLVASYGGFAYVQGGKREAVLQAVGGQQWVDEIVSQVQSFM